MTVTRQSLVKCRTKGCPFTPEEHDEWMTLCRQAPEHGHRDDQLSHQHLPKKGMGGHNSKSKIVAILCWPMHDRIDNGDYSNHVRDLGQGRVYFAQDLHGNTLIERPVLSDGAEAVLTARPVLDAAAHRGSSAPSPSAGEKEEGDGESDIPEVEDETTAMPRGGAPPMEPSDVGDRRGLHGRNDGGSSPVQEVSPDTDSRRPLTHEQRVAIAQEIKDTEWHRQWRAGDTANQWVAELGEEAEQYLSDFGYVHESLANIMRVCAAIPKEIRRDLRFSHHVVVSGLNREDMEMWLDKCEEEEWSVAEFRRQVHGVKPKTKRWTLGELIQLLSALRETQAIHAGSTPDDFLVLLEAQ